ncbi:MAG TPA: ATP-binding cassette domain-containing protein [Acidimicrobiales bacterium]|nr:ATP-binding cassette domain-containing protein [Acidimicrobiales bacterium]
MTTTPAIEQRVIRLGHVGLEIAGRRALEDVNLEFEGGVPVAVTGPSGSGKSALCLVLAGAVEPTRGTVLVDGHPISSEDRGNTGLVLQVHGLVSGLTAAENVALPLLAQRRTSDDVRDRSIKALASVGLADDGDRVVDELSGGQGQRVGIARALAGDPGVLVADEPTAELDPDNREIVLDLLLEAAARGKIVIVASDDPAVISRFPRVVELDEGRVARVTEPEESG